MSQLDHRNSMYFTLERYNTDDYVKINIAIDNITPCSNHIFYLTAGKFMEMKNSGEIPSSMFENGTIYLGYSSAKIKIEPMNTLEERAQAYFRKWVPVLHSIYENLYEKEVELNKELGRINKNAIRDSSLFVWKSKIKETDEEKQNFRKFMNDALKLLPGTDNVNFSVLTPEQAYDNDCCGLYEPKPKHIVNVPLTNYYTGEKRYIDDCLMILGHEAAHSQGYGNERNSEDKCNHDLSFRFQESYNYRTLKNNNTLVADDEKYRKKLSKKPKLLWLFNRKQKNTKV